jgi:hypothetical protein
VKACYQVSYFSFPFALPKSANIEIYKTLILRIALCRRATSLTVKGRYILRVFRTGCLGEYPDIGGRKSRVAAEICAVSNFIL